MSPIQNLVWLELHGGRLWLNDHGGMQYRIPRCVQTQGIKLRLREQKVALAEILSTSPALVSVRTALLAVAAGAEFSAEFLLTEYLTDADLLDIRDGVYSEKLGALRELIESDLRGR